MRPNTIRKNGSSLMQCLPQVSLAHNINRHQWKAQFSQLDVSLPSFTYFCNIKDQAAFYRQMSNQRRLTLFNPPTTYFPLNLHVLLFYFTCRRTAMYPLSGLFSKCNTYRVGRLLFQSLGLTMSVCLLFHGFPVYG